MKLASWEWVSGDIFDLFFFRQASIHTWNRMTPVVENSMSCLVQCAQGIDKANAMRG